MDDITKVLLELPDDVHRRLKSEAALAGTSMKDWITAIIIRYYESRKLAA